MRRALASLACCLVVASLVSAQEKFSQTIGNVRVQPVKNTQPIKIPYITWGGDVATFHANGGLTTKSGSIYDKLGLKMQLTAGDDFAGQVKDYLSGETPFLRGTFRMLGQASEVLGSDVRTKPVVIMQLSWSAGDHIVSRENIKSLNDLRAQGNKKVRIACQKGGPHVGLLYDSLQSANIPRDAVEIVWVDDLTGPNGAAAKFRSDPTIGACCVISPDMAGLTGGIDSQGTGAEGTLKGARVLNSTQSMSRSIADVYAVRKDWFDANRQFVEKFVSGYLKATEDVVALRRGFEESGRLQPEYRSLLKMSQTIFGQEVLPTLEVDAHGLLLDCSFVGVPGQISFFEDQGNASGFLPKMAAALDLAKSWGYADSDKYGFDPPSFEYKSLAALSGAKYQTPTQKSGVIAEGFEDFGNEELDDNTIVSFTIYFENNQSEFPVARYGPEFDRAVKAASQFGNAIVVIRGHSDPTKTLKDFVKGGQERGTIRITGKPGSYRYYMAKTGKEFNLTETGSIMEAIKSAQFDSRTYKPSNTVRAALNLSQNRADKVKQAVVKFAKTKGINLNADQIQPVGAGISDPIVPRPVKAEQARENRRVEFRIVRVPAEAVSPDDFAF